MQWESRNATLKLFAYFLFTIDNGMADKGSTINTKYLNFETMDKSEISILPVESTSNASNGGLVPSESEVPLSKKAAKRLLKKEKWEINKKLRRQNERQKGKKRDVSRKVLKSHTMVSSNCKIGIVIDLSFDDLMIEKDIAKCVKQIQRCYSINRRQENPLQFHVTSFNGDTAKMMEKHDGFTNWDVNFYKESYDEKFDKKSVVYLTSESDNLIENLEDHKFYIIGGLVDHNSKKGLCHSLAVEKGINHARLPIDKFLDIKTRVVLTIDHVFEILVKVSRGLSWQESLFQVIPPRKQASIKGICNGDTNVEDDLLDDSPRPSESTHSKCPDQIDTNPNVN